MKRIFRMFIPLLGIFWALAALPATAEVLIQCPGDLNGDAIPDPYLFNPNGQVTGRPNPDYDPNVKCMHLAAGDGFVTMADGTPMYIFSFADITGVPESESMMAGMLAAALPAPLIALDEGDEFYLNVTNVGMMLRPDLFDPHTVHWHGFPQASAVFDGVPDASISVNMGSTLTYYYNVVEPGTYMYHCHVEATEHMQMGMLGNLYVRPAQDGTEYAYNGRTFTRFAYNDGDGSTGYDVDYAIQIGSFDSQFHNASELTQPLPFALMRDDYPMLNGRGYPDTVNPASLTPPAENGGKYSQNESALITANAGDRILLRISNLNVTRFYTLASLGIPMEVVGVNARLYRGPDGKNLYYKTQSVTLGGGEAVDLILDTAAVSPGTYFLYTANMNYLSNAEEPGDRMGGMMTEIRIN